jgi:hypothetical protein
MVVKLSNMKVQPGKKPQVPDVLHNAAATAAAGMQCKSCSMPQFSFQPSSKLFQAFSTCTLKELCPEDKQKVAKLVKQVRSGMGEAKGKPCTYGMSSCWHPCCCSCKLDSRTHQLHNLEFVLFSCRSWSLARTISASRMQQKRQVAA